MYQGPCIPGENQSNESSEGSVPGGQGSQLLCSLLGPQGLAHSRYSVNKG